MSITRAKQSLKAKLQTRRYNTYAADRNQGSAIVTVNGHPLDPRCDLCNHSPTGFEWGYFGSGPAQLALAILAFEYGDDVAMEFYYDFKCRFIATRGGETWTITSAELDRGMNNLLAEGKKS